MANVSEWLGQNIGNLRTQRGLSQAALASVAKIPRSTLTVIESGEGNPSLQNLVKISGALGVSVTELLSRPEVRCQLIPADRVRRSKRGQGGVEILHLLPKSIGGVEFDRMELQPGAWMKGVPHVVGTNEYFSTLEGSVEITVGGRSYVVETGDVFVFPGENPHSYRNIGRRVAKGVSVVLFAPRS